MRLCRDRELMVAKNITIQILGECADRTSNSRFQVQVQSQRPRSWSMTAGFRRGSRYIGKGSGISVESRRPVGFTTLPLVADPERLRTSRYPTIQPEARSEIFKSMHAAHLFDDALLTWVSPHRQRCERWKGKGYDNQ